MFNLNHASLEVRKAAALYHGIRSGEFETVYGGYDAEQDPDGEEAIFVRVYNGQHPGGIPITGGEVTRAKLYTWKEINS